MKTLKHYNFTEDDLTPALLAARQNYLALLNQARKYLLNKAREATE